MRKLFERRKGSTAFEFLVMFGFLLVFFIVIFFFEIIIINRISACYSAWRVFRVNGISSSKKSSEEVSSNKLYDFENLVIDTLKSSNINLVSESSNNDATSETSENNYYVRYNNDLVKSISPLYYGNKAEELKEKILWYEPRQPKSLDEHN